MIVWLTTALLTGLAGSLHCIGMCGPLAMAVPVGRLPVGQRALARGLYHLGRLSAYSLLGVVVGSVGQGLLVMGLQRPVSILAGILLLVWVVSSRTFPNWVQASPLTRRLTAPLAQLLRQPTLHHITGLGFLNGLLPCGSVYVALTGALAAPSLLNGGLYMLVFGLGTVPAMLSLTMALTNLTPRLRQRFGKAMPLATVLLAVLLIVRGIGLPTHSAKNRPDSIPVCHGSRSM
ncbi:sulfite exporter TauE/SafE family protein [Spirosoma pulveris]